MGRTSEKSNTFWQFLRVGAIDFLMYFKISHAVYFFILKKYSSNIRHITSFEQSISIKQKIQKETLVIAFLYHSYERRHKTRRKIHTIFISSQKYALPKVKSFTCTGKYLVFYQTYCSTHPTRKCWNLVFKWVLSVLLVIKKRLTRLFMHVCVREVRERKIVFTFP